MHVETSTAALVPLRLVGVEGKQLATLCEESGKGRRHRTL